MPPTESRVTLGVAFTCSALPQWVFDAETLGIVAVNDAATREYGFTRDEFLGMTCLDLHPVEERDAVRALTGGTTCVPDSRIWRHQTRGGERMVRLALSDLAVEGRPIRLVQVVDAVVEAQLRCERDAALNEARSACSRCRANEALFAIIAHELRQPLTPMASALAIMEKRVGRDAGGRAREVVKRQIKLLTRIVDDLLDAARVQQGRIALRRETLDLRTLVEEGVSAHFAEISASGITLDTHFPASAVWIDVDPERISGAPSRCSGAWRTTRAARATWPTRQRATTKCTSSSS
jgi:PAS domain S-box-containing protein